MVKCSAPLCGNSSLKKTPEITFHRFPKDDYLKNAWLSIMKREHWQPKPSSVLCSKHFEAQLLDHSGFRTVLAPSAIPTIFDLLYQEENSSKPLLKGPVKRNASGDHLLRNLENLQPSTSVLHYEPSSSLFEPDSIKSMPGYHVLRDLKNIQPSSSSVTPQNILPALSLSSPGPVKMVSGDQVLPSTQEKKLKHKYLLQNKKIKALKPQNRRLKNKVSKFSDIISTLKEKVNQDELHILSGVQVKNKDFFVRYLKKTKSSGLKKSFSPELRSFALQLNFYSPRAYKFVRESFNTVLPHPVTLSRWYKKVDAEPGFTSESFDTLEALAKNSEHKVFVNLSIDEMAIRKGLVWDGTENKFKGYVDTGTDISDDSLPLATQALVILITAINFSWKLPIGYFFIASMTGEQQANIVKMAIEILFKINIFVCGLTFDGAASNISMANHLGCNFNLKRLKPFFMFENMRVNVFYDPCHMIKLIRNALGEFGCLIDKDGNMIHFKYISLLLDLQTEKGLHLANKLKQAHILFSKQKMKVRLAVQLLSKSVADALSFCEDHFEEFKGAKATITFINIINDTFDVLNSRSTLAPGYKKALCNANIQKVKELSELCKDYLMHLKLPNGNFITQSARKTGFVGFIVCLQSALNMYEDLVSKEKLRFLSIYKISQDFLEMFFGKMRARGGFNDNPNVVQFKTAYKKNIIRIKLKMQNDGFVIPNPILTVSSSSKPVDTVNNTTPSFEKNVMEICNIDEDDVDCFLENIISTPLDDYTHHVTVYIAGFIARKIIKVIHCSVCQMLMIGEKEHLLCSLINKKDRGGLIYPSNGLIKIIQSCEKFLKMIKNNINYNSLILYIADSSNHCDLKTHDEHDFNHLHLLIKVIVKFYVDLRMKYNAKQSNLSERNYLKKITLFKNQ